MIPEEKQKEIDMLLNILQRAVINQLIEPKPDSQNNFTFVGQVSVLTGAEVQKIKQRIIQLSGITDGSV